MRKLREQLRVNPIDTQPNTAVGIAIPFNGSPVFISNYTTKAQVNSNIINYFLTNKGERLFNPNFGGNLRSYLFEQTPAFDELHDYLINQMELYFPQVTVTDLEVTVDADTNRVTITISYSINNSQDNIQIHFDP